MIKVFYGNDRIRATTEIKRILGEDYEIVDGAELEVKDLPSLFLGESLFGGERKILIRDLTTNKFVAEKITDYLNTSHKIIILEPKIAKNSLFYKNLAKNVEFREFKLPEINSYSLAKNIYNIAKKDGKKAVEMLEKNKMTEDPISFLGIFSSIALTEFENRQGTKEKRVLKELSKLDIDIKTTSLSPWLYLESFLLRLS